MMDKQVPIPPLKDMPAIDFLGLNVLRLLLKRSHAGIQNGYSKQGIQVLYRRRKVLRSPEALLRWKLAKPACYPGTY